MQPIRPPIAGLKPATKTNPPKEQQQLVLSDEHPTSRWQRELYKFRDAYVTVEWIVADAVKQVTGRLSEINAFGHNCVVDTDTQSVFIRTPLSITRTRRHGKKTNEAGAA